MISTSWVINEPFTKLSEGLKCQNVSVLTSIDNKLTLPIGVDYSPAKGTGDAVLNFVEQRLKQVQVCFNRLVKIDTNIV